MGYFDKTLGTGQQRQSPEDASTELRNRVNGGLANGVARHAGNAAWLAWLAAKTIGVGVVLFFLELLFLLWASSHPLAFVIAFIVGDVVLIAMAYLEIRKRFGPILKGKGGKGIVIGKAYRHTTEMGGGHTPVEVGYDGTRRIDYLHEPNPHVLMLGSTSSGKTTTMRTFVSRVALNDKVPFLILDWNGENEDWAETVGATVWKVPEHFKVNPFKLNGMGKEARASVAVETLAVSARLTALQSTRVKSALLRLYAKGAEPSLLDLWSAVCYKNASKANVLDQKLRAIQRVIGYEPEEFWSGVFSRNGVISMAGLNESEKSLVAYSILQRLTELFDKDLWEGPGPRLMVVIDEAWQLLRREKEYDTARESVAERIVRLGRKYGVGIVVSTQQLEDVPKVFVNSSSLLMIHQHRESSYFGRDILQLGKFESAYMRGAAQGEMLLFDRGAAQKGQWWSEYVKASPLVPGEIQALASAGEAYAPRRIAEPEMPIETQDGSRSAQESQPGLLKGLDIPSVAVYRFLVALQRAGNLQGAYRILREKGWITSKATLYGGLGKPSLLVRAQSGGYVTGDGKLTERSLQMLDPERLIARQGVLSGSEEHKGLMRKTIAMVQDKGSYAFVPGGRDGSDVGEIRAKSKSAWDTAQVFAYECQTNALKEEIEKCIARANGTGVTFVIPSEELKERIAEIGGGKHETIVVG
jgi:hypothetical protein